MALLNIFIEPTGKLITGSVHDCNKKSLERSLQAYDKQLYIKWNPKKRGGYGVWEIRRAPESGKFINHGTFNGGHLWTYEKRESDLIHHVLDCPVLHYGLVGKIQSMDMWKVKDVNAHLEGQADEYEAKTRRKAREDMAYDIKQFRREWRDMADLLQQGADPAQFIKGIKG